MIVFGIDVPADEVPEKVRDWIEGRVKWQDILYGDGDPLKFSASDREWMQKHLAKRYQADLEKYGLSKP
jgi:hypothetical protein